MRMSTALRNTGYRTAILHQGGPVPAVGGVTKPFKPGDLAYSLQTRDETIVTPVVHPDPARDADWSFPDTVEGITSALQKGANVLWANTTLHSTHAIVQMREELGKKGVRMVGQNPLDTERYEDKEWINRWLASQAGLEGAFPSSALVHTSSDEVLETSALPAVVKPVRGRGSHGVKKVSTRKELKSGVEELLKEGDAVIVEEYLAGEETTITVMPPGQYSVQGTKTTHWALPVVARFNHHDGIAPWNGTVAVTANSRVLSSAEHSADPEYREAQRKCEIVAAGGQIFLFDVNMKPNATGPGRPGREDQASLSTMAAAAVGWDYPDFVVNILRQAKLVSEVLRS